MQHRGACPAQALLLFVCALIGFVGTFRMRIRFPLCRLRVHFMKTVFAFAISLLSLGFTSAALAS